jgi:hypothetical protein
VTIVISVVLRYVRSSPLAMAGFSIFVAATIMPYMYLWLGLWSGRCIKSVEYAGLVFYVVAAAVLVDGLARTRIKGWLFVTAFVGACLLCTAGTAWISTPTWMLDNFRQSWFRGASVVGQTFTIHLFVLSAPTSAVAIELMLRPERTIFRNCAALFIATLIGYALLYVRQLEVMWPEASFMPYMLCVICYVYFVLGLGHAVGQSRARQDDR